MMTDRSDHENKSQSDVESTTVPNENNKENSEETKEMEKQGMCSCSGNLQKYLLIVSTLADKDNILQHDVLCVLMMNSDLLFCCQLLTLSSFSSLLPPATPAQSNDHFPEQSTSRPPSTTGVKRRQEQSTIITEDEQGETGVV